ncbi:hypothetical protein PIB30_022634 [Stylosanthes scabra]|uniref:Uncharacterized protein n=1 Tax=Stylosanthes scabra TaxID=79078 RepID=A0ABU6T9X5_9FABA|nr:hypothetical protein [Stylosanthes scabra]
MCWILLYVSFVVASARGRGRGRTAVSSEQTPSPSPTTSTPAGTSQVAPTVPPAAAAPSPQPASTDAERVDATPQPHAESSHASQPDPPAQQKEKIPITWDGQKGFAPDNNECTQAISDTIQLMLNEPWINYSEIPEDVKRRWFDKWATRLLDRPPTDVEVFRETHTRKRNRTIVEKRAEDLLTEFSANLEEATQQAQEEGDDESPATVDPDIVWRQTLSEPYKNRVYGAEGFFASSLRRSGYAGSSASASSCHTGPPTPEVVDLREQKDARAEEHLRRMEEMSRMMAAYYGPLRPGTSGGSAAGIDSTTAPPLPPRPPPPPSHPPEGDDDDDYDDALLG